MNYEEGNTMAEDRKADSLKNVEGPAKQVLEELNSTPVDHRKPYEEPTVVFVPQEALEALKEALDCHMSLNCQ